MSAIDKVFHDLADRLGDRLTQSPGQCEQHAHDLSHFEPRRPEGVAYPQSTEEVQQLVRSCADHRVPIVPFGVGTSLEGHVLPTRGGLCIDMSRMNQVLAVNEADLDVRVQAGVRRKQLNSHLRDTGLFFPIDPGADATLGGMASTRASGTNAVRYGTMKENVLSLQVVLADGRVIRTARRARKSSAGYDLTRLFVGSEGTLGLITEIDLRVYGRPEEMSSARCCFPDMDSTVNAVIETIQMGIPVARIELLDEAAVKGMNAYSKTDLEERPTLLLEFHGSAVSARDQVEQFTAIAESWGADGLKWAIRPEDRNKLWKARHDAAHAMMAAATDSDFFFTDVCVPISRLADCILETQRDVKESGLFAPIVGHVGDGNFHLALSAKKGDQQQHELAMALNRRMVQRAIDMGGTCTGEHGIGMGKMDFLEAELGGAVDVMKSIKMALDPDNLMNPGKIFHLNG